MCADFKILMIGGHSVGRTSVVIRFTQSIFVRNYWPSDEVCRSEVNFEGQKICVDIFDCELPEYFEPLIDTYIRISQSFIIVLSLISPNRTLDVNYYLDKIHKKRTNEQSVSPVIVVGNKVDLLIERSVSMREIQKIILKQNIHYIECSSKTGLGIELIFDVLIKDMLKQKSEQKSKKIKRCILV